MKITVLDGYTLNPGDLSWEDLQKIGDCTIYDRTPPDLVLERIKDSNIVLTNKAVLPAKVINQAPQLEYIGILATGYNVVDIEAAKDRNIPVTNIPSYGSESVAQMTFAHILNLTQRVRDHAQAVTAGKWASSEDFCFWDFPLMELQGKIVGIIGFGRIGRATAKLAIAFGMKVLAHNRSRPEEIPEGVEMVGLEELLKRSDIVSLHCPLTDDNEKMIDQQRLELMKRGAYLINTSRGALIDEQALATTLNAGKIAGAGLDVLTVEPPKAHNPLYSAKNCYITPHISWATKEARQRLLNVAIDNIKHFINGRLINVVS